MDRKYGMPFRGYVSSVPRHQVGLEDITADSYDWTVDPNTGRLVRRLGTDIFGDTAVNPTGLLNAKWSAKARQIVELRSDCLSDGYPTLAVLYGLDSTKLGQLYFRDTNGTGANSEVVSTELSSMYPVTTGDADDTVAYTPYDLKMPVMAADHAEASLHRAMGELDRRVMAAGSRRVVAIGDSVYFPNYYATPVRWNRNFYVAAAGNKVRVYPTGNIQPIKPPTVAASGLGTAGDESWEGKDRFYVSYLFKYRDGSYSMPFICRATTNSSSPTAAGLVTALSGTATNKYRYVTWSNIPIGPENCVARVLLRSPKVNGSNGEYPNPADLRVVAVINNNTQQTYNDTLGNDAGLVAAPDVVRFDHKWPDSARYLWKSDQRVIAAYLKPNPAALLIHAFYRYSASSAGAYMDGNEDALGTNPDVERAVCVMDDQYNYDAVWAETARSLLVVREGTLYSGCGASATTITFRYAINITTTGGVSIYKLQDVVDAINSSVYSSTTYTIGSWAAQVAPGCDASIDASNLRITQVRAGCTVDADGKIIPRKQGYGTTPVGFTPSLSNVKVGMRCQQFNTTNGRIITTNIPASSYVTAVANDGSYVMVSGTVAATTSRVGLIFGWDFGDVRVGEMRVGTNAAPGLLHLSQSWVDSFKPRKGSLIFTGADPGHAPLAANSYYVKNERTVPGRLGAIMGGGSLLAGSIVPCQNGVAILRNVRAGKTGLDDDYRLEVMNESRGCISPYSIVEGNGWVGYMTRDGYVINDGERETIISGDVYNPGQRLGSLAAEVQLSGASAASDGDDYGFHAFVAEGKIYLSYRSRSGLTLPDRVLVYNYSSNMASFGTDQVLSDGRPFGWSAPLTLPYGACGAVARDELKYYGSIDDNHGSSGDGHIEEFNKKLTPKDAVRKTTFPSNIQVFSGQYIIDMTSQSMFPEGWRPYGTGTTVTVTGGQIPAGTEISYIDAINPRRATMNQAATGDYTGSGAAYGKMVRPVAYLSLDFCESLRKKSLQKLWMLYRKMAGTIKVSLANNKTRTVMHDMTAPSTGTDNTDDYGRVVLEVPQPARAPKDAIELCVTDDGSGDRSEVWGIQADVSQLQSER